jgi:hypothetical protein
LIALDDDKIPEFVANTFERRFFTASNLKVDDKSKKKVAKELVKPLNQICFSFFRKIYLYVFFIEVDKETPKSYRAFFVISHKNSCFKSF